MREDTGESGRRGYGDGALEVLKAWCEVRMEGLQVLEMCLMSGGVPAVLSGAMISLWVGRWRSQVPSVNSPKCLVGKLSEVELRVDAVLGSWLGPGLCCLPTLAPPCGRFGSAHG